MTNFERLMQCKTADEVAKMLIFVKGDVVEDRYCEGRGCSDGSGCRQCLKEWLDQESDQTATEEYKPRHMKEDA